MRKFTAAIAGPIKHLGLYRRVCVRKCREAAAVSGPEPSGNDSGQNVPDPLQEASQADVEQVLGELESLTSKLASEVGVAQDEQTADGGTAEAEAASAQSQADRQDAQGDARGDSADAPQEKAQHESPAAESRTAEAPAEPSAGDDAGVGGDSAQQSAARQAADAGSDPSAGDASGGDAEHEAGQVATSEGEQIPDIEDEIDQEIAEVLEASAAGKSEKAATGGPDAPDAAAVDKDRPAGLIVRTVDTFLTVLCVVLLFLDVPFTWVPKAVKRVIGYVAIGTLLTAAVLWLYVLAIRTAG